MKAIIRHRGSFGLVHSICLSVVLASFAEALRAQTTIQEVVVVATGRPASMQSVPVAVTVISPEQIEKDGIDNLRDIQRITPNFATASTQTETTSSKFRIRGISTAGNNIGFESSVGVFQDGVILSRPGIALSDLHDIERIEILRGPQGTLFGRNTSAGSLHITTNSPLLDARESWVNLGAGNFGASSVGGGTNLPLITDRLGLRFSGTFRQRDGYVKSVTGAQSATRDRFSMRGQALWAINDRASLRLIADHADANEQCCDVVITTDTPLVGLGAFVAAGLPADGGAPATGTVARDLRLSNSEGFSSNFDQTGVTVQLNWEIGETRTISYVGSFRDYDSNTVQNADFVNLDVVALPGTATDAGLFDEIRSRTHELSLNGSDGRVDWLVGLSISNEDIEQSFPLQVGSDFAAYVNAVAWYGLIIPATSGTPLEAFPLPTGGTFGDVISSPNPFVSFAGGIDPAGAFAANRYRQTSQPQSIFTHNILALTDQLDLALGARYTEEDKEGSFSQDNANNPACLTSLANAGALQAVSDIGLVAASFACFPFAAPANIPGTPLPVTFARTFRESETTYTANLMYKPSENVGAYVSYAHGFKAGGFNLDATAAIFGGDPRFLSEEIDSLELGVKSILFSGRLRANATVFDMDLENFQVLEFTGVQFLTFNVPEVRSTGLEVELSAIITDALQIDFSATNTDARYPANCTGDDPSPPDQIRSLCGYSLNNAPDWTGSLSLAYSGRFTDDLEFYLRSGLQFFSEQRTSIQPVDPSSLVALADDIQGGYSKLNIAFGLSRPAGSWDLEFWAHNVLDKRTHSTSINIPLRGISSLGTSARGVFLDPPRTAGMNFRMRF